MTSSQRRWHVRIWVLMGFCIAVVLVAALRQRTSASTTPTTTTTLEHAR